MVGCLADLTQMAAEVDPGIIESSKYLIEIMQIFKESSVMVHEKGLNKQLIVFYSHLIMGRKTQNIVMQNMALILTGLLCTFKKEQSFVDKIANCLVVLMNNAEVQGLQTELALSLDMALLAAPFASISEKTRKTLAEILFAFKEQ